MRAFLDLGLLGVSVLENVGESEWASQPHDLEVAILRASHECDCLIWPLLAVKVLNLERRRHVVVIDSECAR